MHGATRNSVHVGTRNGSHETSREHILTQFDHLDQVGCSGFADAQKGWPRVADSIVPLVTYVPGKHH